MLSRFFLLVFITLIPLMAQTYSPGDQWSLFLWKRENGAQNNQGFYCGSKIEDIYTQTSQVTISGNARVDMPGWAELVLGNRAQTQLKINKTKPSSVVSCSPIFDQAQWLETLRVTIGDSDYTCRLNFPILQQGQVYSIGDNFTVSANGLQIEYSMLRENLFVGKLSDQSGSPLLYILTAPDQPLRIRSIEINGAYRQEAETLLGIDLNQFDSDAEAYGLDFLDTAVTFHDTTVSKTNHFDTTVTVQTFSDTIEVVNAQSDTVIQDTLFDTLAVTQQIITDTIVTHTTCFDTVLTDTIITQTTITDSTIDDLTVSDTSVFRTVRSDTVVSGNSVSDTAITITTLSDTSFSSATLRDAAFPEKLGIGSFSYSSGRMSLRIAIARDDLYEIAMAIYTPQGRLLTRKGKRDKLTAGFHDISFDKMVSNGTYFLRVEIKGANSSLSKSGLFTVID